jgi:hypothetical protein
MLAHGFSAEMLGRLVIDGLASVKRGTMLAGDRQLVIVDTEERRATFGPEFYVRARFRDFITPWIEA